MFVIVFAFFVFYAPNILDPPKIIRTVSGLADLMPTIAGICRIPYLNKTKTDTMESSHNQNKETKKNILPISYPYLKLNSNNHLCNDNTSSQIKTNILIGRPFLKPQPVYAARLLNKV